LYLVNLVLALQLKTVVYIGLIQVHFVIVAVTGISAHHDWTDRRVKRTAERPGLLCWILLENTIRTLKT